MVQWAHSSKDAVVRAVGLALVIGACALPGYATQGSARFNVTVDVRGRENAPATEFCRTNTGAGGFGATVTVVCSTGAVVDISSGQSGFPLVPMRGGAYRYLFQITRAGELLGTVDTYMGLATVTSWRVVHLTNRDYLEMTVGW